MMTTQILFLITCSSLLILPLHLFQTCDAKCEPSSCGIIGDISPPFRLKGDPDHCGYRQLELVCKNNVTSIYLNSHQYYVKAINYHNSTIRLLDASLNHHICSFPIVSASYYNFLSYRPYLYPDIGLAWPINFISCPNPVKNSSIFTDIITRCPSNSSHPRYAYVKAGHINASEVPESCELDFIVMTSWFEFEDLNNASLSEIHDSLLYGFQLNFCRTEHCMGFGNFFVTRLTGTLLILLVIVVLFCPAVGSPVIAIILFTAIVGLLMFIAHQLFYYLNKYEYGSGFDPSNSSGGSDPLNAGYIAKIACAPRFIIYPFLVWLLIYKFRRRRLSEYDTIESFLQSESKVAPIRYSYSDIKRMTKGFQDKLGEGGYGSVYKGKLRSGHHVAVKLLGKSGADGQDFMNEIATIGRIHHVNIVNLVGYCAQGSKHALVFDFMHNGSLEKYIFNQENINVLNWDRKFGIAVGVARGIEYLHRGCDIQILHFDIKPHNILLDDEFVPKISDFGLAKIYSKEKNTMTLTAARGTIGYVAPELINRAIGRVSYKADVYSFGMLLIEMVGLNKDVMKKGDDSSKYFPCWIYDHFNQGKDIEIGNVDQDDDDDARKVVRKMTIVALWCIQMRPDDRPSMNKVLEMLEADVERLQIPKYSSQSTQTVVNVDEMGITCSTDSVSLQHRDDDARSVEISVQES